VNTVTEAINALRNTVVVQAQPQARLTKQAYYASLRANPPVYVVPDRPRYGEEVPTKTWQQNLADIMNVISAYRAQNPVYVPFEPGTKTLQARATEAEMASQALRDALAEAEVTGYYKGKPTWAREYAARQLALAAAKAAGGGDALTPSGYYSGYPGVTPAVERELGLTKEEIAAKARNAGVTNSQFINSVRRAKELEKALEETFELVQRGLETVTYQDLAEAINEYAADLQIAGIDPDALLKKYAARLPAGQADLWMVRP